MARIFGKDQQVQVTGLSATQDEIITGSDAYLKHRRAGATGTVCGGVGDTYLVRHDLDHSIGAYTGVELARLSSKELVHRSGDELSPAPA